MNHSYRQKAIVIIILLCILFAMIWARGIAGSFRAYEEGERHFKEGRYVRAVTFFDRAIHWYAPLNPYVDKSAQRLWEIGEIAERNGDQKLAMIAFTTIRQGFYGASHFVTPGRDWIERSESKIKKLAAAGPKDGGISASSLDGQAHSSPEAGGYAPDALWSAIVVIGFLGWVGSVVGFIFFGLRPKDRRGRRALSKGLWWIIVWALFFSTWIVAMVRA